MVLGQVYTCRISLSTIFRFGLLVFGYLFVIITNSKILNKSMLSLALLNFTLILLAGDIAENPGPANEISSLSVLHLNIRSIRNKLSYIEDTFTDFDVLCFTETHLTEAIETNSLLLPGYSTPYRKDKSAHAGGILIYVSDHLLSEREPNLEIFCDECIWLKVKTNCEKYFLCTLYRQPSSSVDFWEALNRNLETAIDSTNKIIIVGDVNEDQLNERNHKLKDILILNSLKNIITSPTRITDTSSTLIDPIIVDQDQAIIKSDVLPIPNDISDHSATLIILPSELSSNTSYTRTVWNYKRADFDKLNELILNADWSVLNIPNIDEATILFTDTFIDLAKQCIPCSEVTIRPNDKPWYNSEIRHTSKLRNRLRKKAIKSGTTDDWKKLQNTTK